jgi:hypothetical protein
LVLLYLLQQYGFNILLFYKNDLIQEKKKTPTYHHFRHPSRCTELGKQTHRMRMRTLDMQNLEHEATK